MAKTATELRDIVSEAIAARQTGDFVESYTLPDGTNVRTAPLETLYQAFDRFSKLALIESSTSDSPFRLARLRPFR